MAGFHLFRNFYSTSNHLKELSSNFHRRSNVVPKNHDRHHYIHLLKELHESSERHTPAKVYENNQLKELCQNGEK